jgi:DNA-binding HxlR family transcriptional regulator
MRLEGYRTAMEALQEIGLVKARPLKSRPRESRWFLTQAGRDLMRALGSGEPED